MVLSRSSFLYAFCGNLLLSCGAEAADRVFDFNVGWVTANPDNLYDRTTIGINGQWPLPRIEVDVGDRVIVNVKNDLGNQSTSIHFHGLYQNGTSHMDGVVGVTQCGIPPGSSFTYDFTVNQNGTYWYHSHQRGQYPDGMRAPFIVHNPSPPFEYDEERILTLSDWYHEQMPTLIDSFINVANPTGAEPVPDSALMNETQNAHFAVEPNKTYLYRIVNLGAFAGQYFWIEGHTMTIVEVDGVYTEPAEVERVYITVAQRMSILIKTKSDASTNFAITGAMDQDLFDTVPATLNPNVTSWLTYNESAPFDLAPLLDEYDEFDDFNLVPLDRMPLLENPNQSYELTMEMINLADGANYASINGVSYVSPKVPTIYSVLTTGSDANATAIYGRNTNAFILNQHEVIEIILNNNDPGKHPFHLHGHNFQAVVRAPADAGYFSTPTNLTTALPAIPMRRDTLMVQPNSHLALRFQSDNPGVWLFHCHIEWHVDSGLIATFIEAPLELQAQLRDAIPADAYDICRAGDSPYAGNAAGNTVDLYDLAGAHTSPGPIPAGFTARGIVALVFSAISAVVGMLVIAWYGIAPLGATEFDAARRTIEKSGVTVPLSPLASNTAATTATDVDVARGS